MAQQPPLPAIGTKAVHKDDYEKTQGPVYEVSGHMRPCDPGQVSKTVPEVLIGLKGAKHKLNTKPIPPTSVTPEEFRDNYKVL